MATYVGVGRTNYYRVTDESRYESLYSGISAEDVIDISKKTEDGEILHGFGVYGSLDWIDPDEDEPDCNLDYFLDEMKKILPEDEAFNYTESGHENLRYVTSFAFVVTKEKVEFFDMTNLAMDAAMKITGNKDITEPTY